MVWYVLVIEAIVFAVLFTTILFVSFHGAVVCTDSGSDCRTVHKFDGLNKKRALIKW